MELFHLTIGSKKITDGYNVDLRSSAGDARGTFCPPFRGRDLQELIEGARAGDLSQKDLRGIGMRLFKSLCKDDVRDKYEQTLALAMRNSPLRLVLTLVADELHAYPWELMYDGSRFLAASGHIQLLRRIGLSSPPSSEIVPPLRILAAVADPVDVLPDLDLQGEVTRIASAMDPNDAYLEIQPAMRHLLQPRLRDEAFDVFHFAGHGMFAHRKGHLCFERENCCRKPIAADAVRVLLEARSVPLVVLSACQSAAASVADAFSGVAQALVRGGIPAVVAMASPVTDLGATDLAREFYSTLPTSCDAAAAVTEARRALYADRLDWFAPVIYTTHVETPILTKGTGARELPAQPSFSLDLSLSPSVPLRLAFPEAMQFTKRPEQSKLADALLDARPRVVTMDGPPGCGKTALAAEMARRLACAFTGGVLGVSCEQTNTLDAILAQINEHLLTPGGAQIDLTQPWSTNLLLNALKEGAYLLILDNLDSVLEAGDGETEKILDFLEKIPAPSKGLVTSRERLDLGQRVWVRTLGKEAFFLLLARIGKRKGIRNFDDDLCVRAQLVAADPEKTDDLLNDHERDVLEQAHRKLGGLPIAAELFMGLVAQGENVLELLEHLAPLHRKMTPLLDMSYRRLSDGAQRLLLQMSVFDKPVKRRAVEAVADSTDWERCLAELVAASLVTSNRYSLHPLVKEYARRKCSDAEMMRAAHRRAAEYFLTGDDLDVLAAIDHFFDAEEWGRAVRLANSAANELFILGLWSAGAERLARAVQVSRRMNDGEAEATSLSHLANFCRNLGQVREAIRYQEQALAIARELGDRFLEGMQLNHLGQSYFRLGQMQRAMEYYEGALHIARLTGDRGAEAARLANAGSAQLELGQLADALVCHQRALRLYKQIGDEVGHADQLGNVGLCYFNLGQVEQAMSYYEESLQVARDLGYRRCEGNAVGNLGNAYFARGNVKRAIRYHEEALQIALEVGDRRGEGKRLAHLGNDYTRLGHIKVARDFYERALDIAVEIGDKNEQGSGLGRLGLVCLEEAAKLRDEALITQAISYFERGLDIARAVGNRHSEEAQLGNLGNAHFLLGQLDEAVACYESALAIAREISDTQGVANCVASLGMASSVQGKLDEAIACYCQAVASLRDLGNVAGEARYLRVLGTEFAKAHDYESAAACCLLSRSLAARHAPEEVDSAESCLSDLEDQLGPEAFSELLLRVQANKEQAVDQILSSHGSVQSNKHSG